MRAYTSADRSYGLSIVPSNKRGPPKSGRPSRSCLLSNQLVEPQLRLEFFELGIGLDHVDGFL